MENTKTVNVISTPNIEGNVGSCTSKAEKILLEGGFWSETGQTIVTNSCTGKVDIYPYYEFSGAAVIVILLGVFFAGVIATVAVSD